MASKMETLWRQAAKTFSTRWSHGWGFSAKNFEELQSAINEIRAEDVGIDDVKLLHVRLGIAPIFNMDIYHDPDFTLSVFLLKEGSTMPLHDHPQMHGLLKVICGTVSVKTYSLEDTRRHDNFHLGDYVQATIHEPVICDQDSNAMVLTPTDKNLHEITCLQGPAAFLDVLSPPYDSNEYYVGERPCTFFQPIEGVSSNRVKLRIIKAPHDYYTKQMEYSGVPLGYS
ncbi:hypothetical protein TKK_0010643 [Trichogramma kaykai]|uniref:2-aminoethanethiol dioxygenase n=1 Tax=Trichogramma kaykai TaxID=54128 RepID=A0ABD2WWV2_9HYME